MAVESLELKLAAKRKEEEMVGDQVKISNGTNVYEGRGQWQALTKEEVLRQSSSAGWVWSRRLMLLLAVVTWFVLVGLAVWIIVTSPKCMPAADEPAWTDNDVIYQVYVRSFRDSDGDGNGDIAGVSEKLDYFSFLGIQTILLSPFYKSPMVDNGYDVSGFKEVDPIFGTMDEFDALLEELHENGLRLVVDFIPNHTSDKHPWFESSKSSKGGEFADYYVWHDGKTTEPEGNREPPNNWLSRTGGSAWEWVEERQQYYLHQYLPQQPDLNFRNGRVRDAMEDVLEYWLEKGVDGVRIDAVMRLFEAQDLTQDEPLSGLPGVMPGHYDYLNHTLTMAQPESYDQVRIWKGVIDKISTKSRKKRVMITEASDSLANVMKYYDSGSDVPFNFLLSTVDSSCQARCIHQRVNQWMMAMPDGKVANWQLGNHDKPRVASRMTTRSYARISAMLLLTLPGCATHYYGDEVAMVDVAVPQAEAHDTQALTCPEGYLVCTRDPQRSPMQWNGDLNAGFSETTNKTWLPVADDYRAWNVQFLNETTPSQLHTFHDLLELRQSKMADDQKFHLLPASDNLLTYIRAEDIVVALNFGVTAELFPNAVLMSDQSFPVNASVEVLQVSGPFQAEQLNVGDVLQLGQRKLEISPAEGVILKLKK